MLIKPQHKKDFPVCGYLAEGLYDLVYTFSGNKRNRYANRGGMAKVGVDNISEVIGPTVFN